MVDGQVKTGEQLIRELLDGLEVDVPVMDVRIAGDMVRLYLYGGRVLERRLTPNREKGTQALPEGLGAMKLDDLRKAARRLGLNTRGVHKADLVAQMRKMHIPGCKLNEDGE